MSVVEGISKHPTLLMEHGLIVLETILPTLADLIISQNGKSYKPTVPQNHSNL